MSKNNGYTNVTNNTSSDPDILALQKELNEIKEQLQAATANGNPSASDHELLTKLLDRVKDLILNVFTKLHEVIERITDQPNGEDVLKAQELEKLLKDAADTRRELAVLCKTNAQLQEAFKEHDLSKSVHEAAESYLTAVNEREPEAPKEAVWFEAEKLKELDSRLQEAKQEQYKADQQVEKESSRLAELKQHPFIYRNSIPAAETAVAAAITTAAVAKEAVDGLKQETAALYESMGEVRDEALAELKAWQSEQSQAASMVEFTKEIADERLNDISEALNQMPAEQAFVALEERWVQESIDPTAAPCANALTEDMIVNRANEIEDPAQRYATVMAAAERIMSDHPNHELDATVQKTIEAVKNAIPEPQMEAARVLASDACFRVYQVADQAFQASQTVEAAQTVTAAVEVPRMAMV